MTSTVSNVGDSTANSIEWSGDIVVEGSDNPLDVAKSLGETGNTKTLSSKYLYHFRKLNQVELIETKKTGNTYVAWPMDMEKLRIIHEMLRV